MDQTGKVFRAEHGMRRCMVCEELFTRSGAAEHFSVICQPKPAAAPISMMETLAASLTSRSA